MTKRTGFLQLEEIPLNKVGLSIRAYGKKKNYVARGNQSRRAGRFYRTKG